jgi:protein-disulfide isomerase
MTRIFRLLVMGAAPFLLGAAETGAAARGADDAVVAEVDGVKLTLGALEDQHGNAMFQAQNSFYEAKRKVVDSLIDDYLLRQQAKKEGVTVAELLKKHVDDTIDQKISEDALKVYYEGLDTKEPFEAVRDKIIEHVRARRLARVKSAYMQSLRDQNKFAILLTPPRAEIALADTPARGPAGAQVTVVEYADYECPYCQQMQPTLDQVEAAFKGKIVFAYKDLPLPMHAHAQKAAEAAQCAGAQNKYWEYHDYLLKTRALEVPQLKDAARQLNLDVKQFDACVDRGQKAAAIQSTIDEAQKLGLQGTPSFFINGRFLSGIQSFEQFKQVIDEELSRTATQTASNTRR